MITGFIESCLERGRTVVLIMVLLLVAGVYAYMAIPKEASPDIPIPVIYVSMIHEGISPEDAERLLVRPMEVELRSIEGIKEMTGIATEGSGSVTLEFEAGFDSEQALADVREAVDLAKAELPEETEEPTVHEVNFGLFPVIVVNLSGDVPEAALLRLARVLEDELESLAEVLEVDIAGEREEVVEIILDPDKVEAFGLDQEEMFALATRNNRLVAAGTFEADRGRIAVKVPGLFEDVEDILNLPIKKLEQDRVLRVRDIAIVRKTFKDIVDRARINGKPGIALEVKKRLGENVIETNDKVRALLAAAQEREDWPEGVEVAFTQDQSKNISDMLLDLQNNMISAVVLVMVVVVGALGLRSGLLVGIAIPGSFLTCILVIYAMGLTMNIVVLFALILAVGMLVDGAIVVVELADRKMGEGLSQPKAYLVASQRMALPVLASTATTLLAFMPLLFWPGMVGEFMKYMPITLIATLTASLAMALVFVPTLGRIFGKPGAANPAAMKALAASEGGDVREVGGFTGVYVNALAGMLKHPFMVLFAAVMVLLGVFITYGKIGKGVEFFPDVEPELAQLQVRMRGNLSMTEIDAILSEVEDIVLAKPGIKTAYLRSGVALQGQDIPEDAHGIFQLEFTDWKTRPKASWILDRIREEVEGYPAVEVSKVEETADQLTLRLTTTWPRSFATIAKTIEGVSRQAMAVGGYPEPTAALSGTELDSFAGGTVARVTLELDEEADADAALRKADNAVGDIDLLEAESKDVESASIALRAAAGASAEELARALMSLREALAGIGGVLHIGVESGTRLTHGRSGGEPVEIARVTFSKDQDALAWSKLEEPLKNRLQGVPGIVITQQKQEAGPPVGKPIKVELSSRFPALLEPALNKLRDKMESISGLVDVEDTLPVPGIEWSVDVDRGAAARYNTDITTVGNAVQFVTTGLNVGNYRPDGADDEIDIRLRYPASERSLDAIGDLRVNVAGELVPVSNFITTNVASKVGKLERSDSLRMMAVSANVDEGVNVDQKANEIREWISEEANFDPRVNINFRGEDEEQRQAEEFLRKAFFIAMFLMGIILVAQFNSFYHASLILTAVVFSTVGVFLGLLFTHQPFGIVMNGIGVISLAGIVVNNNIVLIDTFALHRRNGMEALDAVLRTGAQRLRPVMLTTITTILGLLPMVFKINIDFVTGEVTQGAPSTQWWSQLATSVAFGLAFATLLTLGLTPALLLIGEKYIRRGRSGERDEQ